MKRSAFLASGLALAIAPGVITRAATAPETIVRVFDGNAVAAVPLEQYLYSVVASEMPSSWPQVALQAQAICARTYVLRRNDPEKPYDVVTSEANQVYGGMQLQSPAATAAVDATAGKILRFGNSVASIAYSACCGGRTESSADAWGTVDVPYLHSQNCPWCVASPDYRWTRILASEDISRAFPPGSPTGAFLLPSAAPTPADILGVVQNLTVASTDGSGRAREIVIVGTKSSVRVPAAVFRQNIGTHIVRSLYIQHIASAQDSFTLDGAGYGHGVGLCQWGAKGMAQAKHSVEDILNFYFPGTTLTDS